LPGRDVRHRVKGRPALERSLRRLLIRVERFGRHRARTPEDMRWCARTIDALSSLLEPQP
jgi:hypothetical protein